MPGIPLAFMAARPLPWVSLSSWSGIRELPALSHYFPELAPICRMSGLMGSDVKIYHNLQFPRPPPPLVMMLLARAGSLSWPTEWMNGQLWVAERGRGGVYLGPGAIMVTWSSELASHNPDPAINISLKQSFVTLLNQWNDFSVYRCSLWNLPFTTCLMLQLFNMFMFIVWSSSRSYLKCGWPSQWVVTFHFRTKVWSLTWEANGWWTQLAHSVVRSLTWLFRVTKEEAANPESK